jgi:GNAT superfamily N-acetyltransferase
MIRWFVMNFDAEEIERATLEDLHRAATPELVDRLRLRSERIGAGFVSIAGALPASAIVINRAVGIGLSAPETRESVEAIVAAYDKAGVARYFIQCHPAAQPAEIADWMLAAGLEKARGWQKFHRGGGAVPPRKTDLKIEEIGAEHGEAFARIACDAFDLGDVSIPWLACLPGRPGWHVFMSFDGTTPAGAGTLFVRDGVGWTDFGATDPDFRRRGAQGALLAQRVQHALDLGCRAIYTCTGEEVAGDPQHSYGNILKVGFEEDYVRENYAPPKR